MSAKDGNVQGWLGELDRLEAQIAHDKKLLATGQIPPQVTDWQPPRLGPLPQDLAPRARQVQEDLSQLGKSVVSAMRKNREQQRRAGEERDKLRKIPPEPKREAFPRYLDLEG